MVAVIHALSSFSRRVTSLFNPSLFLFFIPISCITFAGNTHGIKPRVLSFVLLIFLPSYTCFVLLSFSSAAPFPATQSKEQRDTHRRQAPRAKNLPFSSISTWLIARLRTTGIKLLAVVWNSVSFFFFRVASNSNKRPPPSSIINSATDQIYTGLDCRAVFPHDLRRSRVQ